MRKTKTWICILCVALVVCIVVVCVILLAEKKDSSAKKPSQEITTDTGDSEDKQDANGRQNGVDAGGGTGNNTADQNDDAAADIDFPYVDIPADQDVGDSPGMDTPGDNGADDSDQGSGDILVDENGDIVLPMVP